VAQAFADGRQFGQREMVAEVAQLKGTIEELRRRLKARGQQVRRRDVKVAQIQQQMESRFRKLMDSKPDHSIHSETIHAISETVCENRDILPSIREHLEANLGRKRNGVRFSEHLWAFGRTLFLWGGYKAYNFVARNLGVLPAADSMRKDIASTKVFKDGIHEDQIAEVCEKIGTVTTCKTVILHEDGTRLKQGIMWDQRTDSWVGLVTGEPVVGVDYVRLQQLLKNRPYANTAYVYMVTPVDGACPSQVAAIIGTDNKFDAEDVIRRWNTIAQLLKKKGFSVAARTSDGDGKLIKSMLVTSTLEHTSAFPEDVGWLVRNPKQQQGTFTWNIQDPIHLVLKLRNALVNGKRWLTFGNAQATRDDLDALLEVLRPRLPLVSQYLRAEDIKIEDKQNFPSADRLCSEWTRSELKKHLGDYAKGTIVYLEAMCNIADAIYDMKLSVKERVVKLWTTVWFMRLWRLWLVRKADTMRDLTWDLDVHFVTPNSFQSLEFLAHGFIGVISSNRPNDSFKP